jgi:hypothetical protein
MRRVFVFGTTAYIVVLLGVVTSYSSPQRDLVNGQAIFRYDTFGDEQLWTDTLALHDVIETVSPAVALSVGLKVDAAALPRSVVRALQAGQVNINDPAVTRQLIALDAVVGVMGTVNAGNLESIGVTCALCHSTVDDSIGPGIGRRLDGWPNRDLNVGAIIALSPALTDTARAIFNSWGPGRYDPRLQAFDGTGFITLNTTTVPVLIPPAYGLRGVAFETYTGDGPISYWNSYVGVTQMGGHGSFYDPRMPLTITQEPDEVTPALPALLRYQLSLRAPAPPRGSFDRTAARRGELVFHTVAGCAECHIPPTYTDVHRSPAPLLHAPAEVGADPEYASRTVTGAYRTSPLRGIWQHPPYFHDGSAATLSDVIDRYEGVRGFTLTPRQKADLIEFLKSL